MSVPFHTPVAMVPRDVSDEVTTFDASVVPVNVPAGAALNVAKVPNATLFVLRHVITPVFEIVQSWLIATAVATFEPLPTQISPLVRAGRPVATVPHVLSPRR